MGVGHPLELTYPLPGPLPAGAYHLFADGVIVGRPTARFEILWRRAGAADTPIVAFTHAYVLPSTDAGTPSSGALQYDAIADGAPIAARSGDQLAFKVTVASANVDDEYIPISEHPSTPTARMLHIEIP
ncbi:MAG: hypothetical protein EXR72_05630 [Myxococcales bacterium]|nr:hypothetical protein [Myxococcales bacterium]